MVDDIIRIERVTHAIRECTGVFTALDMNLFECAYTCLCLMYAAQRKLDDKTKEPGE